VSGESLPVLSMPRLILWRHGRTEWNAAGRFQGQLDPPLDEVGRRQAAVAAPRLVETGLSADDTVVVSSDLIRAAETAATLSDLLGVPLHLDKRLREHGMGTWEGLTRAEVADRYPEQYADWLAGRPVRGRGGEEASAVAERALAALVDLGPAATVVVVSHGGTAGRLSEHLLGLSPDHRRLLGPLGNCAWSELVSHEARWRLMRHNVSAVQPSEDRVQGTPGTGTALQRQAASAESAAANGGRPPPAEDADAVV
jgi:broad specificity phosphatase PhoE